MCAYIYAYIYIFDNINSYDYLVVFLLLRRDLAKEAQVKQEAKRRYLVLLELNSTHVKFSLSKEKELLVLFKIIQLANQSGILPLGIGKEKGKKENIESCHFNEQPLVGLHKVKVSIKFSPDVQLEQEVLS